MQMVNFKQARQAGFTLIELVIVMVILGIMAATALPKFADMSADARVAKMQAGLAAVKTAAATVHASCVAQGLANSSSCTVKLDNAATGTATVFGWPSEANIAAAAGLSGTDYIAGADGKFTADSDTNRANCSFTYTEAADANTPPTYAIAANTGNCD